MNSANITLDVETSEHRTCNKDINKSAKENNKCQFKKIKGTILNELALPRVKFEM